MRELENIKILFESDARLTRYDLAMLFGVYESTITANIKAIIKSGAVQPSYDCELVQVGKSLLPEVYDMEMVIALAFRLNTTAAEELRRFIINKSTAKRHFVAPQILINCDVGSTIN